MKELEEKMGELERRISDKNKVSSAQPQRSPLADEKFPLKLAATAVMNSN